ncbi:TonB-dependent receptor [Hyphobacterium sp. CCMP332]|nr:TonB-dependent receptor [Hyphobacterium sp. CCMP332]
MMRNSTLNLALWIIILLIPSKLLAQGIEIKGNVTSDDGEVPGASVLEKGTVNGTITDFNGDYTITVQDSNSVLVFSFIGYKTQSVKVGSRTTIDIYLKDDAVQLEEVVVIGYGEQKKSVSTGAISSVGREEIEGLNFQRVEQTLQGQVSGVYIAPASGQPGAAQSIVIRGVGTNGNNNPLYVVDGLVVDDISNLNPNDVESVEVLKDAASTAIYGARGANGVIILTTRRGDSDKATFEYNGFGSTASPWRLPEMMGSDDYVKAIREKFENSNALSTLDPTFPEIGQAPRNIDWMEEVVSPATTMNHNLSVGRTTEKNSYFFSFGYWNQDGVIGGDKSNFERYTARLNSSSYANKYLMLGQNLSILHTERQTVPENNAFGSVLADAFNYDPITPINAAYNDSTYGYAISPYVRKEYINPFARTFITNNRNRTNRLQGNIYAEVSPVEWLKFRSDVGADILYSYDNSFTPTYFFRSDFQNPNNTAFQGYYSENTIRWENFLSFSKKIKFHSIDAILGMSYRERNGEFAGGSRQNIPQSQQFNPNWWYIDAGVDTTDQNYGNALVTEVLQSYFGRVLYNFDEKYLITASLRRDGSSKFGPNNRFGLFPSFSAGWVISKENFFDFPTFDFVKLRASWGVNGNDRINNLAFTSIVSDDRFTYQFGRPGNEAQYFGEAPVAISNPDIKWEESVQWDIGLEVDILSGKLSTDIDVYSKTTKDLLMTGVVPGLVGNNAPILNTGEMRNRGIEFAINYNNRWNDIGFAAGMNFTRNWNEALKVAGEGENPFIEGYGWPVRNFTITRMTQGLPVSHFRGYKTDGIFKSQSEVFQYINSNGDLIQPDAEAGDIKFVDVNGDGEITEEDITDIGKPWADILMGFNFSVDYRGFDIRMLWNVSIGNDVYKVYERQDIPYNNYQDTWLDRWSESNPDGEYPRLVLNDANGNQRPSDFYVEDASFARLRNLQIGYNLPQKILEKVLISKARFYISFDNLITITGYSGFDPEIGSNNGWILDTGIDKGFYPQNRAMGAGLNVTF